MAQYTPHYGLIVPQVTDNAVTTLITIGSSNTIIDTTLYNLQTEVINNYNILDTKIDTNYTTLDTKINLNNSTINNRVDNLILNSAPLPEVAAQEVIDARYSPVYDITYPVLTDRITNAEQETVDLQDYVDTTVAAALLSMQSQIDDLKILIFCGGIG